MFHQPVGYILISIKIRLLLNIIIVNGYEYMTAKYRLYEYIWKKTY